MIAPTNDDLLCIPPPDDDPPPDEDEGCASCEDTGTVEVQVEVDRTEERFCSCGAGRRLRADAAAYEDRP